jgi:hypothetical protein
MLKQGQTLLTILPQSKGGEEKKSHEREWYVFMAQI